MNQGASTQNKTRLNYQLGPFGLVRTVFSLVPEISAQLLEIALGLAILPATTAEGTAQVFRSLAGNILVPSTQGRVKINSEV